jgi:hypothetical protein
LSARSSASDEAPGDAAAGCLPSFLIVFTNDALTPPEPKPYRPVGYCACPEGHLECLQGAFWQCEHINHERET